MICKKAVSDSSPAPVETPSGITDYNENHSSPLKVALIYAFFGAAWILISDKAVEWLFADQTTLLVVQSIKGLLYVVTTTVLVYWLARRAVHEARCKWAEDQYRLTQNLLQKILSSLGEAVFIVDPAKQTITECNPAAELLFGFTRAELIDQSTRILHVNQQAFEEFGALSEPNLEEHQVFRSEFRMKRNDETIIDAEHTVTTIDEEIGWRGGVVSIVHDITERKRAEEALRESEKRFSSAFEFASIGMAMVSPEGKILKVNRAICDLLGYSEDELLAKTYQDITHSDYLALDTAYVEQMVAGTISTYQMEKRYIHKQGHAIWALLSVSLVRDQQDAPSYFISQIVNITERKQAQESLCQSEVLHRTLVDNIPDLVWLKDVKGVYLNCNPTFERFFGAKEADIIGKTDYDFKDKDLADFFREHDRKAVEAEGPNINEEWLTFADGGYGGLFETIKTPMRDAEGHLIGVLGISRDISERKRAEEMLLASEIKYRRLFEAAKDGILILDAETGMIVDVNPYLVELLGYSSELFLGKTIWDIGFFKGIIKNKDKFLELQEQKCVRYDDLPLETAYGKVVDVEFISNVYDIDHKKVIQCNIRNITERKQAEQEKAKFEIRLQQAQKMEAIGSLAGGIAHDLNNILFPISGLSEMMLDDISPDNPEYERIEQIHKSAQRGSDLVKQILAFSRQSNLQKLPIRIQPILEEVLKLVRATIPWNIEIISRINTDCGMVSADPTQLHQIALNLITNAYHAVEADGGTINIELKEAEFEKDLTTFNAMKSGKYACITVSDNGIGIDQTLINKIFDPYFTTKEMGKGTGLGLSVVHGIVKEHSGDIRVYSEIGKGTAFHVYLPLLEAVMERKTTAIIRKYPTGCEKILLVDDEEPIIRMEQMMLEKLGYQITVRTSSPDALAAFKANPGNFDLVISDRGMPNMTGEQLAKELISIKPEIPIIICTGFSDEKDEQRAKAMGIKGFLMKPVAIGDLAEMVRKVLDEVKGTP